MKKRVLRVLKDMGLTILLLMGATAVGWIFWNQGLHETNVVVAYILAVLLIARFTRGYFYGLGATVLAVLAYNWFFTEPIFTLKVNDPTYIITFVITSIAASITSALTSKVKEVAHKDKEKQMEMSALYQLTNHLTDAEDLDAIAGVTVNAVSVLLSTEAGCICCDEDGKPGSSFIQQRKDGMQVRRRLENPQAVQRKMDSLHTSVEIGREFYDYPVYGRSTVLAIIRVPVKEAQELTQTQINMLHSVMESTSLAMERMRSLKIQATVREQAAQEHYRSNLLRAISHDIRTPLSGILGTSEMLMDMSPKDDPRYALVQDIHQDADWLHSLVENILNLTRLQDGRLSLNKQPEAVEEVIGAALMVMEKRLPDREITVSIPDNVLMVPMDARLISQTLINLLDNAGKHSRDNSEIKVSVWEDRENRLARFAVSDRGAGLAPDVLPHVFQMFYTTHGEGKGAVRGVGLGLSICQSIVEAHGGTISARNQETGTGAVFEFTLPLEGDAE